MGQKRAAAPTGRVRRLSSSFEAGGIGLTEKDIDVFSGLCRFINYLPCKSDETAHVGFPDER